MVVQRERPPLGLDAHPHGQFPYATCARTSQTSDWFLCNFIVPASPTRTPTPTPTPLPLPPPASTPPPAPAPSVQAGLLLHPRPHQLHNGQVVHLKGRVTLASVPAGAVVELQAWVGPRHSLTFGVASTGPAGRFSYAYRFTRTNGVQVYLLRARLPRQAGYTARAAASRPVHVTVVG